MFKKISKFLSIFMVSALLVTLVPLKSAEAVTYYYYRTTYSPYQYNYYSNYSSPSYSYYGYLYRYYIQRQAPQQPAPQQPAPQQPAPQQPTPQQPAPQPAPSQPTTGLSQFEAEVVTLVNQERAKNGLSPLEANTELSKVARVKSADMRDKGYFSHTSPTYGSPFDMMKSFGITYRTAGENIAAGQRTPQQVVTAWMNSPGHRANILNANYTEIGVGYVSGGSYGHYWTQMFIGR